jgi:hypothetical protein
VSKRSALAAYGLTEEDFEALLALVDHRCPVCLRPFTGPRSPHIDHDHVSGDCFGPLCRRENYDLFGVFGRDPAFYERAAAFLRSPPAARLPGSRRRAPNSAPPRSPWSPA